jgi:hypothetical protein
MRTLKFEKEKDNRWYVVLPEWIGSKADLEMVAGADTMLEYMAEGEDSVSLCMSMEYFENSDKLEFVRPATEWQNGSFYKMKTYRGVELNLDLWLCDVTLFVFGIFPENIFISKSNF